MNKFVIILILFLLGNYTIAQQPYLNKTFVFDNNNYIQTIIPTDSGYILGGWYRHAIELADSNANTKWLKTYSDQTGWGSYTGDISHNALVNTNHNTYIAGGVMQNSGPTANKVFSVKYSNTFDTLYLKLLLQDTVTLNNYVRNSFVGNNGKYIFLGHSGNSGMIILTDTNSNFLDSVLILKNNDFGSFNTGLQMGNNYYLFGGTYSYAPGNIVGSDRLDGWVVKTDLQGNEVASQNYGNPVLGDGEFTFCIKSPDNKIVTATNKVYDKICYEWISTDCYTFYPLSEPWLLILNDDLSIYKEIVFNTTQVHDAPIIDWGGNFYTRYDTVSGQSIRYMCINSKNEYAVIGSNFKIEIPWNGLNNNAFLTVLDDNLRVRFYREYYAAGVQWDDPSDYVNPKVITVTADGGYIFGGEVKDNTLIPSQQSWLVKTDSLGCDGLQSCNDTALVCQILQAPDTACKNDTAWLQVKFKGRSAPYFIYANTTLALDSVYYPYTLPLWIDTLVPYIPTTLGMQQVIIKVNDPWGWHNSDTVQIFVKNCGTGSIAETWYPKKVEIYPNPATNELHVKIRTTITAPVTITIYNMQGKQVKQIITKQNENVIDISGLEQGVYGVRVVGSNVNYSDRFVKM